MKKMIVALMAVFAVSAVAFADETANTTETKTDAPKMEKHGKKKMKKSKKMMKKEETSNAAGDKMENKTETTTEQKAQ